MWTADIRSASISPPISVLRGRSRTRIESKRESLWAGGERRDRMFRFSAQRACCALLVLGWVAGHEPTCGGSSTVLAGRVSIESYNSETLAHSADANKTYAAIISEEPVTEPVPKPQSPQVTFRKSRVCRVTAYCDRGITAAGVESGVGQCAAPADIPFGTRVYIPKLKRWFVVTDRTHRRFRHNTVDIFIPAAEACRRFGLNYLECEFHLPVELAEARRNIRSVDN